MNLQHSKVNQLTAKHQPATTNRLSKIRADHVSSSSVAEPTDTGLSVFESVPQQTKAMVTHNSAAELSASDAPSVFESQPEKSKAAVTHADQPVDLVAEQP